LQPSAQFLVEDMGPDLSMTTVLLESDLNGLVQVHDGAVAAHQNTTPDRGTGLAEHRA